ncbi:MAG TPA: hypothetical protein VKP58_08220 [Candidatus Acidoferrum sp.]|nr:hypothetical protein [Candidatus Acidoferrum sp.]
MKIVCAWCGKYLGEKSPYERGVTSTICAECREKKFPNLPNRLTAEQIVERAK